MNDHLHSGGDGWMFDLSWIVDNGVAVGILIFFALVVWKLCKKDGPADRLVSALIAYVRSNEEREERIEAMLDGHMSEEEAYRYRWNRVAKKALPVIREASEKLGLSEESSEALQAVQAELDAIEVEPRESRQ